MSTRGCYRFTDEHSTFTVYKHYDNYPDGKYGGIAAIADSLPHAWTLPRFEADEFAAAFVAANKTGDGGVRLLNTPDAKTLDHMPGDIEYLYDVTLCQGRPWIVVSEIGGGFGGLDMVATPIAEGSLAEMQQQFGCPVDDRHLLDGVERS